MTSIEFPTVKISLALISLPRRSKAKLNASCGFLFEFTLISMISGFFLGKDVL
jgi:hypothetical protein